MANLGESGLLGFALLLSLAGLLGLAAGSLLNQVIDWLPQLEERQYANALAAEIGKSRPYPDRFPFFALVGAGAASLYRSSLGECLPLFGTFAYFKRCRMSLVQAKWRYLIVDLTACLTCMFCVSPAGASVQSVLTAAFVLALTTLAFIDLETQSLPDVLTYPLLWAGLLANRVGYGISLDAAVLGAVCGYLVPWILYWAFRMLTGKEGMGHGDFKLLAAIGAWLGWKAVPGIFFGGLVFSVLGVGIYLWRSDKDAGTALPFGPFLIIAAVLHLSFGKVFGLKLFGIIL